MGLLDVLLRKVVQIAGVSQTERKFWNFVSGVTAADNAITGATDLTVTAGGGMTSADKTKLDGIQKQGASIAIAAMDIDWSLGGTYTKTLAGGANTFTFSNAADGDVIIVEVTGVASTLAWPAGIKVPGGGGMPTQTASGKDIYTFVKTSTGISCTFAQAFA